MMVTDGLALAMTKNQIFEVGWSLNLAKTVYDHKLTEYPQKNNILINSALAACFFLYYNGKPWILQ